MANNIVLKTYKGGNVTPQDDAIIQETAIPMNGIFKGCEVSHARGNVLRVSQGFGMIKGRFFEVYESEIAVQLADAGQTLNGRIYIHMDLSNADEPIMLLGDTAVELPVLDADADVNYNNSSFDLQLAAFSVTSSGISNLTQTFSKLAGGAGGRLPGPGRRPGGELGKDVHPVGGHEGRGGGLRPRPALPQRPVRRKRRAAGGAGPVSYTHLTLPTKA